MRARVTTVTGHRGKHGYLVLIEARRVLFEAGRDWRGRMLGRPMDGRGDTLVAAGSRRASPVHGAQRAAPPTLHAYVLDVDDDLAVELDVRMRFAARQVATARVLESPIGECLLAEWFGVVGRGPGLLILDGLVAVDTGIADRTVMELLGPGDLVQPAVRRVDDLLERSAVWRALLPTRFALLDGDFAERVRPWPQLAQSLLRRAERRADDLDILRAISCQPRLEVRLVLLLWHLAARWGRVEPSGVRVCLPLTHRMLGRLVAAERPSVSHALARLARTGLISGATGDWHLHGTPEGHLDALMVGGLRRDIASSA
jgi:CRP/FNR family transcriptional regulator, cyclic AMP receptor protein